jgi:hypothetical protein
VTEWGPGPAPVPAPARSRTLWEPADGDADLDPARPAQGAALLDDDRALGGRAGADEQRSQRSGDRSGSGVRGDPHDGIEGPGVRDGVVVSGLEAVEAGALATRMPHVTKSSPGTADR